MRHLAAAGGMADVNSVFEIEMRGQCGQVIGIVIHVVTVAHLRGTTMAAAVMRDDAIAVIEEEQHLRVPIVGRQRPAMAEYDRLTFPPILVENLHTVLGLNKHNVASIQMNVALIYSGPERSLFQPRDVEAIDLLQQFHKGARTVKQL